MVEGVPTLKLWKKPKEVKVSRQEFLRIKPLRNPSLKWDKDDEDKVTIHLPYKKGGRLRNFFSRFYEIPEEKKVQLDKIGSLVWIMCDGNTTVKKVTKALRKNFKLVPEEAEAALKTYLNQLIERRFLGFTLPKETEARFEEELGKMKRT